LVNCSSAMSGIVTAQVPVMIMLRAMMPGRSKGLYSADIKPLEVITLPKMKTNIIGCSRV